mgnify:CR=1 FL=1
MVNIMLHGDRWIARIDCRQCGKRYIHQVHLRTKPIVVVESIIKTTARTLGWKINNETATCGICRRTK